MVLQILHNYVKSYRNTEILSKDPVNLYLKICLRKHPLPRFYNFLHLVLTPPPDNPPGITYPYPIAVLKTSSFGNESTNSGGILEVLVHCSIFPS